MIEALAVAMLVVVCVYYVMGPVRSGPRADIPATSEKLEDALEKKRSALTALDDIEGEREIGKLSDEDFAILRNEYEAEALQALGELEHLQQSSAGDDLEAEIEAFRARLCLECGAVREPGRSCSRCGAS